MRKIIAVLVFLNFATLEAQGQPSQPDCGTVMSKEQEEFMLKINSSNRRLSNVVVNIPVTIHVIRQSNGSGGLSESGLTSAINNMNNYYQNANMRFVIDAIKYIDDDEFYDLQSSKESLLANSRDVEGTINIYFSNTLSSNGANLCGYTRFPPSTDRVFMANGCISGGTLEHELGHYFTLWHTHGKTNTGSTDELVDGSNCTSAGDNICDTPADPNLSGKVSGCSYTGALSDANGDFYSPNVKNLMSYAPGACRDLFTAGQYTRIRNGFENGRSYLDFTSEGFSVFFTADRTDVCVGSQVEFEASAFGATEYQWTFEGGSPGTTTGTKPKITYNEAGSYDVEVVAVNGSGNTVSSSRKNLIIVEDPLEFNTSDPISEDFNSSIPSNWKIDNEDKAITFSTSEIDKDGNSSSGSLFMDNFGYATDVKGDLDVLSLLTFNKEGIRGFTIDFDYAYTFRPASFDGGTIQQPTYDSLAIAIDDNCLEQDILVWKSGGEALATAPALKTAFEPTSGQWSSKSLSYELTSEIEYAVIKLLNLSYNGNNLYIDNIVVIPDYNLYKPNSVRLTKVEAGVELEWRDNSINEVGFIIQRQIGDGQFINIDTTEVNEEFYLDVEPNAAAVNTYRIVALGIKDNVSESSTEVIYNPVLSNNPLISDFELYPNPFSKSIVLRGELRGNISIYDLSGKLQKLINVNSTDTFSMDLADLQSGTYILKYYGSNGKVFARTILKK